MSEDFMKEKGASDFLAYYIHQPIENWLVKKLRYTWVTPNQVTIVTNILAYMVTLLFLSGNLLAASLMSFIVGIADGIDGKLARAKNMTSYLGKLEHAFDLLYEFSWIAAFSYSVYVLTGDPKALILGMASIVLISFYRYCYDTFSKVFGTSFDTYSSFEKTFRRVAGRRNLYNITILVSILLSIPLVGLYVVAGHALMTAFVYAIRVGQHLNAYDKSLKKRV